MTIERDHKANNEITFACDGCSETFDTQTAEFTSALTLMKHAGWTAKRDSEGEWYHHCGPCSTDF